MTDPHTKLMHLIEQELGISAHALTADCPLAALGDSLDAVALFTAVEETFGLHISAEHSARLATVGDLLRLLQEESLA